MDPIRFTTPLTLDQARPHLETLAAQHGLILDFLMHTWNGRMASYNLGHPTPDIVDPRSGGRRYRIIGRLKFNTLPTGHIAATLSPPTSCDPITAPTDETLLTTFAHHLLTTLTATATPASPP